MKKDPRKAKLLLVDDREDALVALEAVLRDEDCELLVARSGAEALEFLLVEEVALALIDVHMPEMDGFELAELMRGARRTRSIPIIFVTAELRDQARIFKGYESGAVDFLLKPLDRHVLRSKVRVFLELERQKQQLAARIGELEAVLAAAPAAVFVARDAGAEDLACNQFAHEVLRAETEAQPAGGLAPVGAAAYKVMRDGREVPEYEQPIRIAASRGVEVRGYECDLVFEDGEAVSLLGNATPVLNAAGEPSGAVGAFVDVSELKRARERLLEADRRKDDFLAVLSHELRNPLMPIRTSLYALQQRPPEDERTGRALAVIDRQTQHLTRLVDDLLDVTRISRGRIELQRARIDLAAVVRDVVDDHATAFANAGLELSATIAPKPVVVHADATRVAQVAGNLLGNALKFTPRGGRVWLVLGIEDGAAVLRVRDEGLGIGPDMLERIFEPFTQSELTLDRSTGGLGLGLALVKALVEMHGGSVLAWSGGPGSGSEFVVELPLFEEEGLAVSAAALEPAPVAERGQRVLVVEDNVDGAAALSEALALLGYRVEVAYDAPSGIALARSFAPHVVLCDIGLPGMDGYEVARQLRLDEQLREAHLVAISGYASPEDRQRALDAGFSEFMPKPPRVEVLEQLLSRSRRL